MEHKIPLSNNLINVPVTYARPGVYGAEEISVFCWSNPEERPIGNVVRLP